MQAPGPIVASLVALASSTVLWQGPWGNVKSWTGTVDIEATDTRKSEFGAATLTYRATGPFTIADDMLPDGAHMQWPMPSPETLADPTRAAAAYERWRAHVTARYDFKGFNEMGQPVTLTCTADNQLRSGVAVAINPMAPEYTFQVTAPDPEFTCSDKSTKQNLNTGFLRRGALEITGPRGDPGQVTGTKTFTIETTTVKVTFTMAPTK